MRHWLAVRVRCERLDPVGSTRSFWGMAYMFSEKIRRLQLNF
jgi:hypothetical protein